MREIEESPVAENKLYYSDNLDILRGIGLKPEDRIENESVDLVYLDPPFNSQQDYNVLFEERNGSQPAAQIQAFEDTWSWDRGAEEAYRDVLRAGGDLADFMEGMRNFLDENDLMAYLAMMAPRLRELHRVLKPTGSIWLHCDPGASHYLKGVMDAVFSGENFRNEVVWKRTSGHSDARRCGRVHDVLLFYSKSDDYKWNDTYQDYDPEYIEQYYRYEDPDGRKFMSGDLSASGLSGGGYEYEWNGITREWRCPKETMERLDDEDRIYYTRNGFPRLKRYLDEMPGMPLQDVWTDIQPLRSWHDERLGYQTQKPQALLERVIEACTDEGDMVLDPFCGCGTALAAAQNLGRHWMGIDVTHLAISLIKGRLEDMFRQTVMKDGEVQQGLNYDVVGVPADVESAKALAQQDRQEFEHWIVGELDGVPTAKGPDKGIDGTITFFDTGNTKERKRIIISVRSGHNVGVQDVRELIAVVKRENAQIGALVTLEEVSEQGKKEAVSEGFYRSPAEQQYPKIQLLRVEDILEGREIQYPPGTNVSRRKAPRARQKRGKQGELKPQ